MTFKYFPHTEKDIQEMLKVSNVKDLDGLFAEIPEQLKFKGEFNIPSSKSEIEVRRIFNELGKKNKQLICFAGAGAYDHYTPSVINAIVSRAEFLTSYTPYQAEISQGTLQYIFEYQTLIADLTGMDISNANLYDGATATAEAMLMAVASGKKKDTILISGALNPQTIRVVETYAKVRDIKIITLAIENGQTSKTDLEAKLAEGNVAGVIVGQPNYFGIVEDFEGFADLCHAKKALLIMNAQASPLAVLKTPGEWGADIACGDAQSLGVPLSFGGPYIGYIATNSKYIRKMPGRIVGATTDTDGNRTFVLTMQAREQHIRREKATSNICSNQGLMSLFVTIYMSLMGEKGLKEVNETSYSGAHYLCQELITTGKFTQTFDAPFLNEFCLRYNGDVDQLQQQFIDNGILGGVKPEIKGFEDCILFAVTEQRTKEEIDQLIDIVKSAK